MDTDVSGEVAGGYIKLAKKMYELFQGMMYHAMQTHNVQASAQQQGLNQSQPSAQNTLLKNNNNNPVYVIIVDGHKFDFRGTGEGYAKAMNFLNQEIGIRLPDMDIACRDYFNNVNHININIININASNPEEVWGKYNSDIVNEAEKNKDVDSSEVIPNVNVKENDIEPDFEGEGLDIDM